MMSAIVPNEKHSSLKENGPGQPRRIPDRMRRAWYFLCVFVVVLLLFPIRNEVIRIALMAGASGVWAVALVLFGKRPPVLVTCLFAALVPTALLLLPGRSVNADALRYAYVTALRSYAGTPYVWGGETRTGIDCSGLVRQGMVQAEMSEGLRTGNGALLRDALYLWWDDCSARALGEEYHGRTIVQRKVSRLNFADYSALRKGDLAVIGDGVHVLAYIADQTWIQADPQAGSVIITPTIRGDNRLDLDAILVRWRIVTPL